MYHRVRNTGFVVKTREKLMEEGYTESKTYPGIWGKREENKIYNIHVSRFLEYRVVRLYNGEGGYDAMTRVRFFNILETEKVDFTDYKELEEYPGYLVNKEGKVYCCKMKCFTGYRNGAGYLKCSVKNIKGEKEERLIHHLVLLAFKPEEYRKLGKVDSSGDPYVTNHIDGNKQNNHPDNLEVIGNKANLNHAHRTGLCDAKKRKVVVRYMAENRREVIYPSLREAAKSLNRNPTTILERLQHPDHLRIQWIDDTQVAYLGEELREPNIFQARNCNKSFYVLDYKKNPPEERMYRTVQDLMHGEKIWNYHLQRRLKVTNQPLMDSLIRIKLTSNEEEWVEPLGGDPIYELDTAGYVGNKVFVIVKEGNTDKPVVVLPSSKDIIGTRLSWFKRTNTVRLLSNPDGPKVYREKGYSFMYYKDWYFTEGYQQWKGRWTEFEYWT